MSLSASLQTAARSLEIFSTAIQVSGQNISNVSTEGYVREEIRVSSGEPYRRGTAVLGTGSYLDGVRQVIDQHLETRIHNATGDAISSETRFSILRQLEGEIAELGESDLSTALSQFLGSLHDVANEPEEAGVRQLAISEGAELARNVVDLRSRVDDLRDAQTARIDGLVTEANGLIDEIADINVRIAQLEAWGRSQSDAGALRTQRYQALNRLSEIIPVRYNEQPDGTVYVYADNDYLVLGRETQKLSVEKLVDRGVTIQHVRFTETQSLLSAGGGEIGGILQARDEDLAGFVDDLDAFAANLTDAVNQVHSSGEGTIGFSEITGITEVLDSTVPLNQAQSINGLPFAPSHGSFQLKVRNDQTGSLETATLAIDLDGIGSDTTLDDLVTAVDAIDNVSASLNAKGQLLISSADGFSFSFANDTSGVLAGLGVNTFFAGKDSATMQINSVIQSDHRLLATGRGGGAGDGSNALALAEIDTAVRSALGDDTLDGFYRQTIADLAGRTNDARLESEGFNSFRESLLSQRAQFSGVSLDEEAVRIMEYQRAYQASARVISTVNDLLLTLLNM